MAESCCQRQGLLKKYTEEQILAVLNEAEAKTVELCRRHGMSEAAFYKWKAKYAGLTLSELKRLRSLGEAGNGICCRESWAE